MSTRRGHILVDKPPQPVSEDVPQKLPSIPTLKFPVIPQTAVRFRYRFRNRPAPRTSRPSYKGSSVSDHLWALWARSSNEIYGYYRPPHSGPPNAPLRVIHGIIDALKDDVPSLKQCSLVAKTWRSRSRQWLFEAVVIKSLDFRLDLVHASSPDLSPAGYYAKTLRLVQHPWVRWIEPRLLPHFSHHFSVFTNVTSLTIDALPIYLFNQAKLRKVFGHFFRTVTELGLEGPQSNPHDLIAFLRHFSRLDSLTISDPEWVETRQFLFHPRKALPPCEGKLELIRLCPDSYPFIRLLSRLPLEFKQLSILDCSLEGSEFDYLLDRLGESLRLLAISAWFGGFKFPAIRPARCTGIEELRFFAGMFLSKEMPFQQIYATLDSVASTRVRKVALDLNVDKAAGRGLDFFLRGVGGLDERLCRMAEASAENIGFGVFTVALSALYPFLSAVRLGRVRRKGKLVLGTRYRGSNVCGEVFWLGEDRCLSVE